MTYPILTLFEGYQVNLAPAALVTQPERSSLAQKIAHIVKNFFIALGQAGYETLKNSKSHFKTFVLGVYPGSEKVKICFNLALIYFKISLGLIHMGMSFLLESVRRLYSAYASPSYLRLHMGNEIDPKHIATKKLEIDVRHVPESVSLRDLLTIWDQIDFQNPASVHYVDPAPYLEGMGMPPREQLERFIDTVTQRLPFFGSPTPDQPAKLKRFHQQIENAIRFCLDHTQRELEAFRREHSQDPANYPPDIKRDYQVIFTNRASLAISMAAAAQGCGGRWIGTATTFYRQINFERSIGEEELKETLGEILAEERLAVAKENIARDFANPDHTIDVHSYNTYFERLGSILALPDSEYLIDQLGALNFDTPTHLKKFFEAYTVDRIIDAIQKKIIASFAFREKIIDWLKREASSWQTNAEARQAGDLAAILQILRNAAIPKDSPAYLDFSNANAILSHLREQAVEYPDRSLATSNYLDDLFSLEELKPWFTAQLQGSVEQKVLDDNARLMEEMKTFLRSKISLLKNAIAERQDLSQVEEEISSSSTSRQIVLALNAVLDYLREKNSDYPDPNLEDEFFLEAFFRLEKVTAWFDERFQKNVPLKIVVEKRSLAQAIKNFLSPQIHELKQAIAQGRDLSFHVFQEGMLNRYRASLIQDLGYPFDTALQIAKGESDPHQIVRDCQATKEQEFLEKLQIDQIHERGLSKELLEWLLVSHEILLPQKRELLEVANANSFSRQEHRNSVISAFRDMPYLRHHHPNRNDRLAAVNLSKSINQVHSLLTLINETDINTLTDTLDHLDTMYYEKARKRFRFQNDLAAKEQFLHKVFSIAFQNAPDRATQQVRSSSTSRLSRLRKLYSIALPKAMNLLLKNNLSTAIIAGTLGVSNWILLKSLYNYTRYLAMDLTYPWLLQRYGANRIVFLGSIAGMYHQWGLEAIGRLFLSLLPLISLFATVNPRGFANFISRHYERILLPINIISSHILMTLANFHMYQFNYIKSARDEISRRCFEIAKKNEEEEYNQAKAKALSLFVQECYRPGLAS